MGHCTQFLPIFRYFFRVCYRWIPAAGFDASIYLKGSSVNYLLRKSASPKAVMFFIDSFTVGGDMHGYSMYEGEGEVFFLPIPTFIVEEVEEGKDGITMISISLSVLMATLHSSCDELPPLKSKGFFEGQQFSLTSINWVI